MFSYLGPTVVKVLISSTVPKTNRSSSEKTTENLNKPGTAQVGAISKAQKRAKGLQNVKVLVNWGPFYGKNESLNAEKKLKGRTLWDFSTSILSQHSKKIEKGDLQCSFMYRERGSQLKQKQFRRFFVPAFLSCNSNDAKTVVQTHEIFS